MGAYRLISDYMVPVIVVLGIVLTVLLIGNYVSIKSHYEQIESIMNLKKRKSLIDKETHEIIESVEDTKATPEDVREYEKAFSRTCSWHEAFSQLISLFPLFGILGTVAGLIMKLQGSQTDINLLYKSLYLALQSTFVGLIFAIALKFFDTVFPARVISETEIILNDYDKMVNNAAIYEKISE